MHLDSRLATRDSFVKPVPDDIDEWTHYLHGPDNNAVSRDRVVASPRSLQWIAAPVYGRHHNHLASLSAMVSAGGRLLSIEDFGPALSLGLPAAWRLVARDAFNGVTLWERPVTAWQSTKTGFRSGPVHLPRRLVAVDDSVYVALNLRGPLLCLDPVTGETVKTFEGTEGTEDILYADGILYLVAADTAGKGRKRILAVNADGGETLWTREGDAGGTIMPATLAVGAKRLFYHDGTAVVAVDKTDGDIKWRKPLPSVAKRPSWLSPTVVYHDGVILCADRAIEYPEQWRTNSKLVSGTKTHGGPALLTALSTEDGAELWHTDASECFHGAPDVFVIDSLVWASQGPARFFYEPLRPILAKMMGPDFYIEKVTGRELRTGRVARTVDAAEAFTLAHHHRCFRNKATERFIIMGRTGIEFISLDGGHSLRHNWTRGMCQYGVMPANGLLYTPPHPCACYNASKLNGFFAYSGRRAEAWREDGGSRLSKGPAFGRMGDRKSQISNPKSQSSDFRSQSSGPKSQSSDLGSETSDPLDWPTYRSDNARSGCGRGAVPDRPKVAWQHTLGGRLSAPTSADGKVFVCSVEQHAVHALDLDSGKRLWSHAARGRVDSPPTYWRGRVYFGAADGSIQCLSAADGVPVWRFDAAPRNHAIVVRDQLESPWPVAGSVLVRDGAVYALAGRSSYLDGGMHFLKLDAVTGELQLRRRIYSRDPETGRQTVDDVASLYLAGIQYDVPSSVGDTIFMREACLSLDGAFADKPTPHLYSPGGLLDGTWWHRYSMIYGSRFRDGPGGNAYSRAGGAPNGRLLVHDNRRVYGYGETAPNRYRLSCVAKTAKGGRKKPLPTVWSNPKCPIMVHAMVLVRAAETARLVIAGPQARALHDVAVLRGNEGGLFAVVDASTGEIVSQRALESIPVFDGMCVARGQVVLCLKSGCVVSLK